MLGAVVPTKPPLRCIARQRRLRFGQRTALLICDPRQVVNRTVGVVSCAPTLNDLEGVRSD
jgi:hypothetical protein